MEIFTILKSGCIMLRGGRFMDIYLLYAYVGAVCAVVIAIILNRVKSTEYKETVDTTFCKVLGFFIGFCAVDAAWGIIGSPVYFVSRIAYVISTYGFHLMAAWVSFVCSGYVLHHLNLAHRVKKFSVIRIIFISAQMILILQNIFTGLFSLSAKIMFTVRVYSVRFLLQFCHYIPILVYVLIASFKKNGKETAYTYRPFKTAEQGFL